MRAPASFPYLLYYNNQGLQAETVCCIRWRTHRVYKYGISKCVHSGFPAHINLSQTGQLSLGLYVSTASMHKSRSTAEAGARQELARAALAAPNGGKDVVKGAGDNAAQVRLRAAVHGERLPRAGLAIPTGTC